MGLGSNPPAHGLQYLPCLVRFIPTEESRVNGPLGLRLVQMKALGTGHGRGERRNG